MDFIQCRISRAPNTFTIASMDLPIYTLVFSLSVKFQFKINWLISFCHQECPVAGMPTIFYYDLCVCEFPEKVPGCSDYTGEPNMTTRAYQFKNLRLNKFKPLLPFL